MQPIDGWWGRKAVNPTGAGEPVAASLQRHLSGTKHRGGRISPDEMCENLPDCRNAGNRRADLTLCGPLHPAVGWGALHWAVWRPFGRRIRYDAGFRWISLLDVRRGELERCTSLLMITL